MEHRRVKRHYERTNKNDPMFQIAKLETRERHFYEVERHFEAKVKERTDVPSRPEEHHHIGYSQRDYVRLSTLLASKKDDPAYKVSCLT